MICKECNKLLEWQDFYDKNILPEKLGETIIRKVLDKNLFNPDKVIKKQTIDNVTIYGVVRDKVHDFFEEIKEKKENVFFNIYRFDSKNDKGCNVIEYL